MSNIDAKEYQSTSIKAALESIPNNRRLGEYLTHFKINASDLGKTVLDLGSGDEDPVARDASKLGIRVFSVNPLLANELNMKTRKNYLEHDDYNIGVPDQKRTVIALAQNLPFKPESFDSILSLYAVPMFLPEDDYAKAFSEIYRVLKSNGKAFMGPLSSRRIEVSKKALGELGLPFEVVGKGEITDTLYEYDGTVKTTTSQTHDLIIHKPPSP